MQGAKVASLAPGNEADVRKIAAGDFSGNQELEKILARYR
jgi:hypothetical protein